MSDYTYFKITNFNENHHGYQYQDGLNVLDKPFEKDGSCVEGGLYFTDLKNIYNYYGYGCWLREITLPLDDPDFQMVEDVNIACDILRSEIVRERPWYA